MPTVNCQQCGEELLGEVNACWRCGAAMVPTMPVQSAQSASQKVEARLTDLAPVQQPTGQDVNQISAEDILDAELVAGRSTEEEKSEGAIGSSSQQVEEELDIAKPNVKESSQEVFNPQGIRGPRRGSPFAGGPSRYTPLEMPAPTHVPVAPLKANYPTNTAATGGAYGSLVMAAITMVGAFILPYLIIGRFVPICGIVTSLLGLGLGVWGISSERRGFAMLGAFLCIILLVASCFYGLADIYTQTYGYRPWEAAPVIAE